MHLDRDLQLISEELEPIWLRAEALHHSVMSWAVVRYSGERQVAHVAKASESYAGGGDGGNDVSWYRSKPARGSST